MQFDRKNKIVAAAVLVVVLPLLVHFFWHISVHQAAALCNKIFCLPIPIRVEGELQRGGSIDNLRLGPPGQRMGSISIDLSPKMSDLDKNAILEKNFLLGGGIIQATARGVLHYANYGGFGGLVMNVASPSDIKFIKKIRCPSPGEPLPTLSTGSDCFATSSYAISSSDAMKKLQQSKICTQGGRKPTGIMDYVDRKYVQDIKQGIVHETGWSFQMDDKGDPGGCSTYCTVTPDKIKLDRQCAEQGNNLNLEE